MLVGNKMVIDNKFMVDTFLDSMYVRYFCHFLMN